jgi:hypothetical protein
MDPPDDPSTTSPSVPPSVTPTEEDASILMARLIGAEGDAVEVPVSVSGMFGTAIREWRTKNWINEVTEAVAILRARGVAPEEAKQVPTGDLHRIFENGSKVDDPALRSLWSALLANSADPHKSITPRPLNRLGPLEASLLEFLWSIPAMEVETQREISNAVKEQGTQQQHPVIFQLQRELKKRVEARLERTVGAHSPSEVKIALSLLIRDDLLSPNVHTEKFHSPPRFPLTGRGEARIVDPDGLTRVLNDLVTRGDLLQGRSEAKLPQMMANGNVYYHLTPFGRELMDACH